MSKAIIFFTKCLLRDSWKCQLPFKAKLKTLLTSLGLTRVFCPVFLTSYTFFWCLAEASCVNKQDEVGVIEISQIWQNAVSDPSGFCCTQPNSFSNSFRYLLYHLGSWAAILGLQNKAKYVQKIMSSFLLKIKSS